MREEEEKNAIRGKYEDAKGREKIGEEDEING